MAGKFVLKKSSSGKDHFVLKAGNGDIIATAETYYSKAAARNGIKSVQRNAPGANVDDETGEFPLSPRCAEGHGQPWES